MTVKIIYQKPGMGIEDGTLARWVKAVGDRLLEGDVVAEIETAKAITEVLAPCNGTLVEATTREGTTILVNAVIGLIEEDASPSG